MAETIQAIPPPVPKSLPRPKKPEIRRSKISMLEWGMIIAILFLIDAGELILGLMAIGEIVNTFIDFIIGVALYSYLWFRGEDLSNSRRIYSFFATFILELIPFVNDFPLWGLEGIYLCVLSRIQNREADAKEKRYAQLVNQTTAIEKRNKIMAIQQKKMMMQEQRALQEQQQEEEEAQDEDSQGLEGNKG